ncbi:hypothetical protein JTE90_023434 [Oedothorax gibbosus]|uniref:Uncharacterized protein n=1 Tax=Oedothorax gibbosus TaxID=931172 RepID=A0AAV6U0Q6_9ARAC|nr:hypothetical protein JTE90_023434 [Oedothorax gibbosus]
MREANGAGHFVDWLLQFGNGELPVEEFLECADVAAWFFEDVEDTSNDLINRIILSPRMMKVIEMNLQFQMASISLMF